MDMSWFSRIANERLKRVSAFFLINEELVFCNKGEYHIEYLQRVFKLEKYIANYCQEIFPRGSVDFDNNGDLVISISDGLEPYMPSITDFLNISRLDRPTWEIGNQYYAVNQNKVENELFERFQKTPYSFDKNAFDFIKHFMPNLFYKITD